MHMVQMTEIYCPECAVSWQNFNSETCWHCEKLGILTNGGWMQRLMNIDWFSWQNVRRTAAIEEIQNAS